MGGNLRPGMPDWPRSAFGRLPKGTDDATELRPAELWPGMPGWPRPAFGRLPKGTDDATELQPHGGGDSPTSVPDSRREPAMGTHPSVFRHPPTLPRRVLSIGTRVAATQGPDGTASAVRANNADSRRVPAEGTRPCASLAAANSSPKSLASTPDRHDDPAPVLLALPARSDGGAGGDYLRHDGLALHRPKET